jgi:hypothetical protein
VNLAREEESSSGITTFHSVGCKPVRQKMALLADVSDDQRGMGSVWAISSDENKVAPAAAMQTVRRIPSSFFPSKTNRSCMSLPGV